MGYWLDGNNECEMKFEHYGNWNDKELEEHEEVELGYESKHGPYWRGFEIVQLFKRERSPLNEDDEL